MPLASLPTMTALPGTSSGTSGSFDLTLVALSFVISVFGALCGLQCAKRARERAGAGYFSWLAAAAVSIGAGAIWSMHFIGMLAYHNDVSYSLGTSRTLISLAVAVLASGLGLYIAGRGQPTIPRYLGAGTIVGLGAAGMHYLAMSAMQMHANLSFRTPIVALSVVIAIVACSIALFFAFTVTELWATISAAIIMGIGVCGMYYTAMAGTTLRAKSGFSASAITGIEPLSLALPVFGIASVLLFVLLFVGLFDDIDRNDPLTTSAAAR